MKMQRLTIRALLTVAAVAVMTVPAAAQYDPAAVLAHFQPKQPGVDFSQPTPEEAARCTIEPSADNTAQVAKDSAGNILRIFADTSGDGQIDRWSYFKDGLEVYREIDSNSNQKPDQYRWFHSAGMRWGIDQNEDGVIDAWKAISAEEVTAEIVAALAAKDAQRFMRVALTADELQQLGLGEGLTTQIGEQIATMPAQFAQVAASQQVIGPQTEWIAFSGNRPGIIPAGRDGAKNDIRFYGNVVAFVKTGEATEQIPVGNLIQVGDTWRAILAPPIGNEMAKLDVLGAGEAKPLIPEDPTTGSTTTVPTEAQQKLMADLRTIDDQLATEANPQNRVRLNEQRAATLQKLAQESKTAEDQEMWLKQLADSVSAASQMGEYPNGAKLLGQLADAVKGQNANVAAYIEFRRLSADYGMKLMGGHPDYLKDGEPDYEAIQSEWLENLEAFVQSYPTAPEGAEAMVQLGNHYDFAGQDDEAIAWYKQVSEKFPGTMAAKLADGATRRLTCEGQPLQLEGKTAEGQLVDLNRYQGRVVLVQYWASWCEPCKADMAVLKDLLSRYGQQFSVIGVNLDQEAAAMQQFLSQHNIQWANIHEDGGLGSDPAMQLGIMNVPTMILVDQTGKVVNRNVRTAELDREVSRLMK